jgi:small conductance mechanosensitive channel
MSTFFQSILLKLKEIFNPEVLGIQFAQLLNSFIVIVVILAIFYLGWRILHIIIRPALKKSTSDETTITFIETLIKYGVLTIALITALGSAGIQISAVLASLGIVGLTIGFAARDALSNIIS